MNVALNLFIYISFSASVAFILIFLKFPAGALIGSLLGAGFLSVSGLIEPADWPIGTNSILGIGVGTFIGTSLNKNSLSELQLLWKPALIITSSLIISGLLISFLLVKIFGIDPLIAFLGSAPGGTIGMSLVGSEFGVGAAVAALHAVRLITLLVIIPITLRLILPILKSMQSS